MIILNKCYYYYYYYKCIYFHKCDYENKCKINWFFFTELAIYINLLNY